jgi:hypothetical protein
MQLISEAATKTYAKYQKALLDKDLLTIRQSNFIKQEYLSHKIKHFEKFINLAVNIRNLGNRRNGYQNRHFLMEVDNYRDNLKELKRMKETNF